MNTVTSSIPSDEARLLTQVSALAISFARRLVRRDAAKDLAQEVVLACLVRLRAGRWSVHTSLKALVCSMTWHKYESTKRDAARRRAREAQYVDERIARLPAWMDPELILDEQEEDALRERALSELPAGCRTAFLLVREEGATYRAASERLGVSCGVVFTQVARAEQHLASRLIGPPIWQDTAPTTRRRARRPRHTRRVRPHTGPTVTAHDAEHERMRCPRRSHTARRPPPPAAR